MGQVRFVTSGLAKMMNVITFGGDYDDGDHDYDDGDLPGPATSVRTVRVAEEFPSCLLVNAFAQIVYFLYGSAHFIFMMTDVCPTSTLTSSNIKFIFIVIIIIIFT